MFPATSIDRIGMALLLVALVSLAGCRTAAQCCTEAIAARASTWSDMTEPRPAPPPRASGAGREAATQAPAVVQNNEKRRAAADASPQTSQQVVPAAGSARFEIPEELPGADAPPLKLPSFDLTQSPEERRSMLKELFPDVPEIHAEDRVSDQDKVFTLAELQQIALDHSPVIRQAAADVEQARGLAVQAGLYPNPTVGYQGDTIPTSRSAGYNGLYASQQLVTANKLGLAHSAETMRMRAAEQNLRKARITLATDVRRGYFDLLIAQEQLRFNRAIAQLTQEVYQAQIELVAAGQAAPYEPLQLRVFAVQARNSVVQAENALNAAWRTLSARMGVPNLPHHRVAGAVDVHVPGVDYAAAAAFLLSNHSDLHAAQALISATMYNLRLQEVTPIPNVEFYTALQHDDTTEGGRMSFNMQLGVPLPVFNKNQGNIAAAHAQLVRANQDLIGTRNDLLASLADAFNRYATSRVIVSSFRDDILPDQVRVYRGIYERFRQEGETIDFAQVVVAQQNLAQAVTSYLEALREQWGATVAIAELLQVDDLFAMESIVGGPPYGPGEN